MLYTLLQINFLAPVATKHPLLPCFSHSLTLQHLKSVLATDNLLGSHKLSLQLPRSVSAIAGPGLHQTHTITEKRENNTRTVTARHRGSSLTYTTRRPFTHNEASHCNIARLRTALLRIIIHTPLVSTQLVLRTPTRQYYSSTRLRYPPTRSTHQTYHTIHSTNAGDTS